MISPTRPETPWSTLVPAPQCPDPSCGKLFYGISEDDRALCTRLTCRAKGCRQEWWICLFTPGDVGPQLAREVGSELAAQLMVEYGLPRVVSRPAYWQLALTPNQVHHRRSEINSARARGQKASPFPLPVRSNAPAA